MEFPPPDSLWRHLGIVERRGLSTGYMSLFKLTFQQFAAFADRNSRVILVIRELVTSHRSNGTYQSVACGLSKGMAPS